MGLLSPLTFLFLSSTPPGVPPSFLLRSRRGDDKGVGPPPFPFVSSLSSFCFSFFYQHLRVMRGGQGRWAVESLLFSPFFQHFSESLLFSGFVHGVQGSRKRRTRRKPAYFFSGFSFFFSNRDDQKVRKRSPAVPLLSFPFFFPLVPPFFFLANLPRLE